MNEKHEYTSEDFRKFIQEHKDKIPVYRGCPSRECFCTGKCKEIVGYRDRFPGEVSPFDSFPGKELDRNEYERDLRERQANHLDNVKRQFGTGIRSNWKPCLHDSCPSCIGTGVKTDGSICVHMISCDCPKCSPTYSL